MKSYDITIKKKKNERCEEFDLQVGKMLKYRTIRKQESLNVLQLVNMKSY